MKILGLLVGLCLLLFPKENQAQDYALFFACNNYQYERPLTNPISNAREIAEILKNEYGFDTTIVANPTRAEIENALEAYKVSFQKGKRDENGQLLIFFSGHGAIESNVGFFLPVDAKPGKLIRSALDYRYWQNYIDEIPCKHIFVAVDACQSVRFDPLWNVRESNNFERPGELSNKKKLLLTHQETTSRIFFTSDGKDQETPDKSTFAKKFLEGLKLGGGEDDILTSAELYARVKEAIPTPHCGEFGRDESGSSFLFRKDIFDTKADLSAWNEAKKKNTIEAYNDYLAIHEDGDFRKLAQKSISSLETLEKKKQEEDAWQQAQQNGSVATYQDFVKRFPRSKQLKTAKKEIQRLEAEATRKREEDAFAKAKKSGNYLSYLENYPKGIFRQKAQAALAEKEAEAQLEKDILAWQKAKSLNTESAYRKYLADFPNGNFSEVAQVNLGTFTEIPVADLPNLPKMILIKGGTFQMGSTDGESDEKPVHSVTVSDFYLAETEITFSQYDYFCEQTGRIKPNDEGWGRGNRPVINVTWDDATAYCSWLSEVTGDNYCLPREAEWEYAAGGGGSSRTKWAGTDLESSIRRYGNYNGTSRTDRYPNTAPVKSFRANSLGLFDMSGNVWEWCQDWYSREFYELSLRKDPENSEKSISHPYRVVRGGSWGNVVSYLRVANRDSWLPEHLVNSLGFRPARIP